MITVFKHGKTEFKKTCDNCGCEFSYEVEDVVDGKIACPDCHKEFPHIMTSGYISTTSPYWGSGCRKFDYPPENMLLSAEATTNANKANVKGTLYDTQGDMHTTEKDLEIQQAFKDQMSKTTAIPCVDKE